MQSIERTLEYQTAKIHLSGKISKRTKADYFEHVYEGVRILQILNQPLIVQQAFAIHPLYQSDESLTNYFPLLSNFNPTVVALTMEYRAVANQGIRSIVAKNDWTVKLSCLESVNSMLVSDKIQNRKLFLSNYSREYKNYADLARYFEVWLTALGITEKEYQRIVSEI